MDRRLQLQTELEEVLGSRHVYYQPTETKKLEYPCIVYQLSDIDLIHGDDLLYRATHGYQITLIERSPETPLVDAILGHFRMIRFDRRFVNQNLYHNVFELYY